MNNYHDFYFGTNLPKNKIYAPKILQWHKSIYTVYKLAGNAWIFYTHIDVLQIFLDFTNQIGVVESSILRIAWANLILRNLRCYQDF